MADFFAGITGVAGLGLELYGAFEGAKYAKEESQISQQEIGVELQQDQVRRQAMELSATREMTQQKRIEQAARSQALAANVSGGQSGQAGQMGSTLGGAYGSISGQIGQNILGVSQNLQFGEKMFDLNAQLDQLKMQMAGVQGNAATAQGLMSAGSGIMNAAKLF